MWRTRAQGREARDRIGEGGREAKKHKKKRKIYIRDVENEVDWSGKKKNVDEKVLVSGCRSRRSRKKKGSRGGSSRRAGPKEDV